MIKSAKRIGFHVYKITLATVVVLGFASNTASADNNPLKKMLEAGYTLYALMNTASGGDTNFKEYSKKSIREQLKDPESARFRDLDVVRVSGFKPEDMKVLCGEVNAKNSFGGYVGYKMFISAGDSYQLFEDMPASSQRDAFELCQGNNPWTGSTNSQEAVGPVETVQAGLKELGYYEGAVDGIKGPKTENAIRSYRKDRNMIEGSHITPALRKEIDLDLEKKSK